jgi:ATP-dependent DNA helicase RecQ
VFSNSRDSGSPGMSINFATLTEYLLPTRSDRNHVQQRALALLRTAVGSTTTSFRPDQWEAIQRILNRERLLLVERTGWGKSSVYFLATRLLRDKGSGCALLVSPLLSLMRNQLESAHRLGLRAETINSANVFDWHRVQDELRRGRVDILLISPERLANEDFLMDDLLPIAGRVGLFVVDEAHCISDWGHDFRPDHRRIIRVLRALPPNVPVLATTATANDRVVADLQEQLGPHLTTIRGTLVRESLNLGNIVLPEKASRMAWLAHHVPRMQGSGIIYTLTKKDAENLAAWLQLCGINVMPYHAGSEDRERLEELLLHNEVKALVATVALGMGFDKPDVGFVIHFQRPASVVHYYQQVGRAGRALDTAHGVLLSGEEDDEIAEYFIRTAFPDESEIELVLDALRVTDTGLKLSQLQRRLNLTTKKLEKTLAFLLLESPSPIQKIEGLYFRNPVNWQMPRERVARIVDLRRQEQRRMREYIQTGQCLMQFLSMELNDPSARACGKCTNCTHAPLPTDVPADLRRKAAAFLENFNFAIQPRKQWPPRVVFEGQRGRIDMQLQIQPGRTLCRWGDPGLGGMVRRGKKLTGRFADELVTASVKLIRERWNPQPAPTWITWVPSHRHNTLVPDFAQRLATQLHIPFVECVRKVRETESQKSRQTSVKQVKNLERAFEIDGALVRPGPVLLVDDMVDSRWTLTVLGFKLRMAGSGLVFPFALADSSPESGD